MHRRIPKWMHVLAISGMMAAGGFGTAIAQETEKPMKGMMSGSMMEECKSMMSARRQMKAEMKAATEELDALVATMNAAEGDAKIAATASTLTELVAQHTKMTSKMMSMQPRMMQHMTQHMRMSMKQGEEGAMECPMMKEMAKENPGQAEP